METTKATGLLETTSQYLWERCQPDDYAVTAAEPDGTPIVVTFSRKPSPAVKSWLRTKGFRWDGARQHWTTHRQELTVPVGVVCTTHYGLARQLAAAGHQSRFVSISIRPPRWWRHRVYHDLAPTAAMLGWNRADYDQGFRQILQHRDKRKVLEEIGPDAILFCYEQPNQWCHRRLVAEWLQSQAGYRIAEIGLTESETLPYSRLPTR